MEAGFADKGNEIEPVPDVRLDIRNYQVGDRVRFKIKYIDSDEENTLEGTVEIIDRNPGWYSSIDIMSGDGASPLRRCTETYRWFESTRKRYLDDDFRQKNR